MARTVRNLLSLGNQKLGESIHVWSIPANDEVCIGATERCRKACYARKSRFLLPQVQERLTWNLEQARLDTFVPRMVQEVKRRGCLVVRVHSSGDFFSKEYAEKWLQVMRQCPRPRFYWYSRSWRVPEIAEALEQMAALKCCRAWYSVDSDSGLPERIPPGVRLAYLQTSKDEAPELADLTFRVRRLRKESRIGLPTVCPSETPKGRAADVTCGSCRHCFE